MNNITPLAWDTDFFGFSVGKVIAHELSHTKLDTILEQMKTNSIKLVYCFTDPNDTISNTSLKKGNYELVDEKVTYVMSLSGIQEEMPEHIFSVFHAPVNEHLISLALQSGEYSRFKIDTHILPHTFERLYKTWIENSLKGEIADDVLVYKQDDQEIGLITLGQKNQRADIGLLAVDERYRGKSIGKKLIHAACHRSQELGFTQIQVVTQKSNKNACLFYERVGFFEERVENIYHIWV